jgi:GGDEF domain-containing protein
LRSPFNLGGHEVFAAASIGILLGTKGYERPEELLHDADIAMYRAKAQGKGCYEVFDK